MTKRRVHDVRWMAVVTVALLVVATGVSAKTYTMVAGDTLWELANKFYGDPTVYSVFLEVNKIDNPRAIPVGTTIVVPSYDEMRRIANTVDAAARAALINQVRSGQGAPETPAKPAKPAGGSQQGGAISSENTAFDKVINDKVDLEAFKKNADVKPFTPIKTRK